MATPMSAEAAASLRSASRTSGRRASRSDGNPVAKSAPGSSGRGLDADSTGKRLSGGSPSRMPSRWMDCLAALSRVGISDSVAAAWPSAWATSTWVMSPSRKRSLVTSTFCRWASALLRVMAICSW